LKRTKLGCFGWLGLLILASLAISYPIPALIIGGVCVLGFYLWVRKIRSQSETAWIGDYPPGNPPPITGALSEITAREQAKQAYIERVDSQGPFEIVTDPKVIAHAYRVAKKYGIRVGNITIESYQTFFDAFIRKYQLDEDCLTWPEGFEEKFDAEWTSLRVHLNAKVRAVVTNPGLPRLAAGSEFDVVGESFYSENFHRLMALLGAEPEDEEFIDFELLSEPENKFSANGHAVAVKAAGMILAHISESKNTPFFKLIEEAGGSVLCEGRVWFDEPGGDLERNSVQLFVKTPPRLSGY